MVLPELRQAGPSTARTVMSPAAEETLTTGCSGTSHHWQPAWPELETGVLAYLIKYNSYLWTDGRYEPPIDKVFLKRGYIEDVSVFVGKYVSDIASCRYIIPIYPYSPLYCIGVLLRHM